MTRKNLFAVSIIGLLLINSLLIAFIAFRKPPHPDRQHEGPKNYIINSLKFDKDQIDEYEVLIKTHRKLTRETENRIRNLKSQLYGELSENNDHAKKDSLFASILTIQSEIEHINYDHFLEIKNICRPNQMNDFIELTNKMADFFIKKPKERP